jgi:hypothetical protein
LSLAGVGVVGDNIIGFTADGIELSDDMGGGQDFTSIGV